MKKAPYYLLDVFTEKKYGGNQLAIFPEALKIPDRLLQIIARELNLSETVYLYPQEKEGYYPMRIFTPASELPTAGHPSVGTAFYLSRFHEVMDDAVTIYLKQPIGIIKSVVNFKNNLPDRTTIFPPKPQFGKIYKKREMFARLISLEENELLHTPIQEVSCGIPYVFIPVKSIDSIKRIQFRLDVWKELREAVDDAFIYAFTPAGEEENSDLHGRMFAPEAGILEDAATGSANAPLGAYAIKYELAKSPMISEQGYEMGRPSKIFISVEKDTQNHPEKINIGGKCQFIGKGEIFLD